MAEKCWVCPNFNSEDLVVNNGVITYAGNNLTQQCCTFYGTVTNQTTTFTNGICNAVPSINISNTDVVYIAEDGKVYKRSVGNIQNSPTYGGSYFTFTGPKVFLFDLPQEFKPSYSSVFQWRPMAITFNDSKMYILNQAGTEILVVNITLNPFTYSIAGVVGKPTDISDTEPLSLRGLVLHNNNLFSTGRDNNSSRVSLIKLNDYNNPSPLGSTLINNTTYTTEFDLLKPKTTGTFISGVEYTSDSRNYINITNTPRTKLLSIGLPASSSNPPYINQDNFSGPYLDTDNYFQVEKGAIEFRKNLFSSGNIDGISVIKFNDVMGIVSKTNGSLYKITYTNPTQGSSSSLGSYSTIYQVGSGTNSLLNETNTFIVAANQKADTLTLDFDVDPNAPSLICGFNDLSGNPLLVDFPCSQ